MSMHIKQIVVGPMQNFAYLLWDHDTKEGAIIDPGWEHEKLLKEAERLGLRIIAVLLTHTHFDHLQDLEPLLRKISAPVYVHEHEAKTLPSSAKTVTTRDGSKIVLGKSEVLCHHTPGHSPGCQCFEVDDILVTGDTLFIDSCGRIDLPGSDPKAMKTSLAKLVLFREQLVVYPGHDYGETPTATLGEQKKTNPYLRK